MNFVFFLERVGFPLVNFAQGVTGWHPPEVLPPWGWSIGFLATPRTVGRTFNQRDFPAFFQLILLCASFAKAPRNALQFAGIFLNSPEGILIKINSDVFCKIIAKVPPARTNWDPFVGFNSTL